LAEANAREMMSLRAWCLVIRAESFDRVPCYTRKRGGPMYPPVTHTDSGDRGMCSAETQTEPYYYYYYYYVLRLRCWTSDQQVASSIPAAALSGATLDKLFARVPLSQSSIIGTSHWVMSCDWEGNRKSVSLATHWPRVTDVSDSPSTG